MYLSLSLFVSLYSFSPEEHIRPFFMPMQHPVAAVARDAQKSPVRHHLKKIKRIDLSL